jgi:hypothetical protein
MQNSTDPALTAYHQAHESHASISPKIKTYAERMMIALSKLNLSFHATQPGPTTPNITNQGKLMNANSLAVKTRLCMDIASTAVPG